MSKSSVQHLLHRHILCSIIMLRGKFHDLSKQQVHFYFYVVSIDFFRWENKIREHLGRMVAKHPWNWSGLYCFVRVILSCYYHFQILCQSFKRRVDVVCRILLFPSHGHGQLCHVSVFICICRPDIIILFPWACASICTNIHFHLYARYSDFVVLVLSSPVSYPYSF